MPKLDVLNVSGETVESKELNENIFSIEPNEVVLHSIVKNYLANQRQGTQSAQTRSEVTATNAKPFRQKGTGNARQGSRRSPINTGGGVIFAPKPRSYRYKLPKKKRVLAMKSALSAKVDSGNLIVVDKLKFDVPKTKDMVNTVINVSETSEKENLTKTLVVLEENDKNVYLSGRNIPNLKVVFTGMLNVYDLLNHEDIIITKGAVDKLEEVYG